MDNELSNFMVAQTFSNEIVKLRLGFYGGLGILLKIKHLAGVRYRYLLPRCRLHEIQRNLITSNERDQCCVPTVHIECGNITFKCSGGW